MNWYSIFWKYWSWVAFLPMLACCLYRMFTQKDLRNLKKQPDREFYVDWAFEFLLSPGLFYYTIDSLYIILQYENYSWCNLGYLSHHVLTLAGARATLTVPYYPWTLIAPFVIHCMLIMFPYISILNYIYLGIIFNNFRILLSDPWRNFAQYRWVLYIGISLVLIPFPILWLNSCKNDMQNVN
ncbi:unnamed protein product [Blepharisma stoltei]|uniref:TLC domain-containing protein n=1 Tax=Blepharisma stoltei TaxID=1481888 RepID=A0AAU9K4T6_9CILI|nr:unnamed protein product [Blepharisma stoltei]